MRTDILKIFLSNISREESDFVSSQLPLPELSEHNIGKNVLDFYDMYNLLANNIPVNRKSGRYFTPLPLADILIKKINLIGDVHILEPSVGIGIFIFRLLDYTPDKRNDLLKNITLIEKDSELVLFFKLLMLHYIFINDLKIQLRDIDIRNGDFLTMDIGGRYGLILGNPPFIDTKFFGERERYRHLYPIGKRNIFSMFIEKSLNLVSEKGEIAFIVSESFIYLKSYYELRKIILNSNFSVSIHKMDKNRFHGANIGSVILHLKKGGGNTLSVFTGKEHFLIPQKSLYIKDYILPFNNFDGETVKILQESDNLKNHTEIIVGIQTNNVKAYVTKQYRKGAIPYIKRLKRRISFWQKFDYWLLLDTLKISNPAIFKEKFRNALKRDGIIFNNIDYNSIFIAVYKPKGYLFDIVTPCIFPLDIDLYYLLAYLNSDFARYLLFKFNSTPHTNINDVFKLPYSGDYNRHVPDLAKLIIRKRKYGIDITPLCKELNELIYDQFHISDSLKHIINEELRENGIIFDKKG